MQVEPAPLGWGWNSEFLIRSLEVLRLLGWALVTAEVTGLGTRQDWEKSERGVGGRAEAGALSQTGC